MKQKTKQAARKRFKVSSTGKVKHRIPHQAHFNAKDSGKETRRKHGDGSVSSSDMGRIHRLTPYLTNKDSY
ncbi:MAG: 50S ribosomal protein L35 [Candidatus Andersenbacteria bacterium]